MTPEAHRAGSSFLWKTVAAGAVLALILMVGGYGIYLAEVGRQETLDAARFRAGAFTLGIGTFVLLLAAGLTYHYRRRQGKILLRLDKAKAGWKESEDRMSAITDAALDAILMMDPVGKISYWNPAAERLFGYTSDEAIGQDLHALIAPPRYHAAHHAAFPGFLKTGEGAVVGKTRTMEARRKDGTEIAVQLSLSAIQIDGAWHAAGILRDITAEKRAQEELAESETRFAQLAEQSRTFVWEVDADGLYTYASHVAEAVLGYPPCELVGRMHFYDLHPDNKRQAFRDAAFKVFAAKGSFNNLENSALTKDGRTVWIATNGIPLLNADGSLRGYRGSDKDITEQKQAESQLAEATAKAEKATAAKSEFLATMTHELRNPLTGVLGFAEILAGTPLDDEQQSYTEGIRESGVHLLSLINDVLDFSSIEKGALAILPAPFDLAHLVKSSSELVRKDAADKGIAFHCDVAADVPAQITGDERRIRQILINLLANAVKFTSDGSVSLRVTRSGEFLEFSVEDTGIGISSEALARLFQLFTQADSTINKKYGGTGIGLAVSGRLAEAMGGTISVVSVPGKGSTFTFRLPLAPPTGGTGVPPVWAQNIAAENSAAHGLPFRQAKGPELVEGDAHAPCPDPVLVVDDDTNSRTLAGKMLQSLGYRVEFAADGAEAIQAFVPGKYLTILMDMAMPLMDGLEAAKKIREIEAATEFHIPIIAFTANVMPGEREQHLAAGMDDFLSKPFKKAELAAKLACVKQGSLPR